VPFAKGDWKLVRGNTRYNDRKWELYNLANDRCETVDLIESKPELAKKLKEEWLSWAIRMKINPYYEFVEKNPTRPLTKIPKTKRVTFFLGMETKWIGHMLRTSPKRHLK
jgi:hypothetical protein